MILNRWSRTKKQFKILKGILSSVFFFEILKFNFSGKDISIIGDETIGEKSLFEGPDPIEKVVTQFLRVLPLPKNP